MKLHLYGGFGEKGRICIGIETGEVRFLLDAGLKTGCGGGDDVYPAIGPAELARQRALIVSHAHEDHAGALGWCLANGFAGEVLMTPETSGALADGVLEYFEPAHRALLGGMRARTFACGEAFPIGDAEIATGRSGHAVGGVWLAVSAGGGTVLYCADVMPASGLLAMDPPPPCDVILLDASYGADAVAANARAAAIAAWVGERGGACLLPAPLFGRALELVAALPGPIGVHRSMRAALARQAGDGFWLRPGRADDLHRRLAEARPWDDGDPFPPHPLVCHDGMGLAGPARALVPRALDEGVPVLFTGHLPKGSPGERAVAGGRAEWMRLPTHPTLEENLSLVRDCAPRIVLGHSCANSALAEFQRRVPGQFRVARTGETLIV